MTLNPRLDPYRNRSAHLWLDGRPVGRLYIQSIHGPVTAGHLWWKKVHTPPEECICWSDLGDGPEDPYLVDGQIVSLADDLDAGKFRDEEGVVYDVRWDSEEESLAYLRVLRGGG